MDTNQMMAKRGIRNMYQIALCDDELAELDKLENMLDLYGMRHTEGNFSIKRFAGAEQMLQQIREGEYEPDLLLLDIYMHGKLGTEAARELRDMGISCGIVFLTSSKEHALEAFRVDAAQYLVKPISDEKLFQVLDRFLKDMEEKKRYILLKANGLKKVELHDIVYCEAQRNSQNIILADGMRVIQNMTMAKLYEKLSGNREFVKVGISYIVNLEHINYLNSKEMQMDNGEKIYLPRGSYKKLQGQYLDYYCRRA